MRTANERSQRPLMLPTELLRRQLLFGLADDSQLSELCRTATLQKLALGDVLFRERDPAQSLFILKSGRVRVVRKTDAGKDVTVATCRPGELIGDYGLLAPHTCAATCRLAADSELWQLPMANARELLKQLYPATSLRPWLRLQFLVRFLRKEAYLGFMSAGSFLRLLDPAELMLFGKGETIQAEGLHSDSFFLVQEGTARLTCLQKQHSPVQIQAGGFFGLKALADESAVPDFVEAESTVTGWRLRRQDFLGDNRSPDAEQTTRLMMHAQSLDLPMIRQESANDCGAAALAMLAGFHKRQLSLPAIRHFLQIGNRGVSLTSLSQAAEHFGFTSRAVRISPNHLSGVTLPVIAHLKDEHYVVIYAADQHRLILGDPGQGIVSIDFATFRFAWTGVLVLITPRSGRVTDPV